MRSSRVKRWDLVVGVLASLVAISGLGLSIAVGNTASVGFGRVHRETQNFLAVLGATFLILIAIKTGLRYRKRSKAACGWSVERMLNQPWRRR
ncbi:MAG: hypothetical protein J0H49_02750 [Acidobacteria bacterium]|nr:hypothetical protein [Acidobacteriota bacterium]